MEVTDGDLAGFGAPGNCCLCLAVTLSVRCVKMEAMACSKVRDKV